MNDTLVELINRLTEIDDLNSAASLLHWDQTTYMPPGGAAARGRQLGTLRQLAHEKFTAVEIGRLLDAAQAVERDEDDDDARLLRVTRRQYEQATKVPTAFEARLSDHIAATYQAWTVARPANDFAAVCPLLEKTLDLSREMAQFFPGYQHIADPLIDFSDLGMTVATVRELLGALRAELVPLVQTLCETDDAAARAACLRGDFPEAVQLAFGHEVIAKLGYDFARGRQDKTHHPFMTKFSLGDVRITTRFRDDDISDGLFSTIHETGHALYEQGIDPAYEATPLGDGASSGVHESQSRLWENIVGRSRGFWSYWYPRLQQVFPAQLGGVGLDDFYRAINTVSRSLIRTDADEVTYNLHVMIRFDLELAMLEGTLAVRDLPEAWRERYRSDLGIAADDDKDGCLQDVHWYGGTIGGAFQGYTIGNVLSAAIFGAAVRARPSIPGDIEAGEFGGLHGWLRENLYRYGSKYTPTEIIERVTGGPLSIGPYMEYLRGKYGALYGVSGR